MFPGHVDSEGQRAALLRRWRSPDCGDLDYAKQASDVTALGVIRLGKPRPDTAQGSLRRLCSRFASLDNIGFQGTDRRRRVGDRVDSPELRAP